MPCGKSFWAQKNLLRQNCSHPRANAFLMDFGEILRSKIPILRVKARRKTHKCIALGQFGSIPVRLCIQEKQPVQYCTSFSMVCTVCTSQAVSSCIPATNARVGCMVSLASFLGLPFNINIFMVILRRFSAKRDSVSAGRNGLRACIPKAPARQARTARSRFARNDRRSLWGYLSRR